MSQSEAPTKDVQSIGPLWTPTVAVERMQRECDQTDAEAMVISREQLKGLLFDSMEFRRLHELVNTPHTADFLKSVKLEAIHQRERWGSAQDSGKTDADWFWLVGYLAGKALHKPEKQVHHIITTAAALLNWHAAVTGTDNRMRPGIDPPGEQA